MPMRMARFMVWAFILGGCLPVPGPIHENALLSAVEKSAYEYNRLGMVHMSMAQFDEAILDFEKAALSFGDYQVRGKSLVYTPNFMAGWASEKMARVDRACDYFQKFLKISPAEWLEASKAQHARSYLQAHCNR